MVVTSMIAMRCFACAMLHTETSGVVDLEVANVL